MVALFTIDGENIYCMNTFFKKQPERQWIWISLERISKQLRERYVCSSTYEFIQTKIIKETIEVK